MGSEFPTSLKQSTLVCVALRILKDLKTKEHILAFNPKTIDQEDIKILINLLGLPRQLSLELLNQTWFMVMELQNWIMDNQKLFDFSLQFCSICIDLIHWTAKGNINKKKTAEGLIKFNSISFLDRYYIACIYCLEEVVIAFHQKYDQLIYQSYTHVKKEKNRSLNLFSSIIRGNREILEKDVKEGFLTSVKMNNAVAAEYFWNHLSSSQQSDTVNDFIKRLKTILANLKTKALYFDNFSFLFVHITEAQIEMILRRENYKVVFNCLLMWSSEELLLKICKHIWIVLSTEGIERFFILWQNILAAVLEAILTSRYKNYNVLKSFFDDCPEKITKYVEEKYCNTVVLRKIFINEIWNQDMFVMLLSELHNSGVHFEVNNLITCCHVLIKKGCHDLTEQFINLVAVNKTQRKQFQFKVILSANINLWTESQRYQTKLNYINLILKWSQISEYIFLFLNGNFNCNEANTFYHLKIIKHFFEYCYTLIDQTIFIRNQEIKTEENLFEQVLRLVSPKEELIFQLKECILSSFLTTATFHKQLTEVKDEFTKKLINQFEIEVNKANERLLNFDIGGVKVVEMIQGYLPKEFKNLVLWSYLSQTDPTSVEIELKNLFKKKWITQIFLKENNLKCFTDFIKTILSIENGFLKFKCDIVQLLPKVYYKFAKNSADTLFNNFLTYCFTLFDESKILLMDMLYSMMEDIYFKKILFKGNLKTDSAIFKAIKESDFKKWKRSLIESVIKDANFELLIYKDSQIVTNFLYWCLSSELEIRALKKKLFYRVKNLYFQNIKRYKYNIKTIDELLSYCLKINSYKTLEVNFPHLIPLIKWCNKYSSNIVNTNDDYLKIITNNFLQNFRILTKENNLSIILFCIQRCLFQYSLQENRFNSIFAWFELSKKELDEINGLDIIHSDIDEILKEIQNRISTKLILSSNENNEFKKTCIFYKIMSYIKDGISEWETSDVNKLIDFCCHSETEKIAFKKKCISAFELNDLPQKFLNLCSLNAMNFYISIFLSKSEDINELKINLFHHLKQEIGQKIIGILQNSILNTYYILRNLEEVKDIINWFPLSKEELINYKKEILNKNKNNIIHLNIGNLEIINNFICWCLQSEEEIKHFKKSLFFKIIANGEIWRSVNTANDLDTLIKWCSFSSSEIKTIKEYILYSLLDNQKLQFVFQKNNLCYLEDIITWSVADKVEVQNYKKKIFPFLVNIRTNY